ncbi:MAG TPA: hypothetical protein VMI54_19655, partial [Polyangiaceae bacterium]|nr:hypothetical protein [Polyangiaceae bacterium]
SNNQCVAKISNTATSCSKDIQCSTGKCCSTCVDSTSDNNNCGSCGNKCSANRSCQSSSCACVGYTFPAACGSTCGSWSFESGPSTTEGWTEIISPEVGSQNNGALNAAISTNRPSGYPGSGSYSLVVPVNVNGSTTSIASVGVQFCQPGDYTSVGGYNLTGYVYFSGPAFPTFASFSAYTWGADPSEAAQSIILLNTSVVPNTWIQFTEQMDFGFQYDHLALGLGPNGAWSGTMYLDDIQFTGL